MFVPFRDGNAMATVPQGFTLGFIRLSPSATRNDPGILLHNESENYLKSRKPRHIGKVGIPIWLAVCYGEADTTQLRIEN